MGFIFLMFDEFSDEFDADDFRRIQRLDLSAWLAQSVGNTDKLDKKKVRVK